MTKTSYRLIDHNENDIKNRISSRERKLITTMYSIGNDQSKLSVSISSPESYLTLPVEVMWSSDTMIIGQTPSTLNFPVGSMHATVVHAINGESGNPRGTAMHIGTMSSANADPPALAKSTAVQKRAAVTHAHLHVRVQVSVGATVTTSPAYPALSSAVAPDSSSPTARRGPRSGSAALPRRHRWHASAARAGRARGAA